MFGYLYGFLKMKYEMFLMGKLERLLDRFNCTDLRWYPAFLVSEKQMDDGWIDKCDYLDLESKYQELMDEYLCLKASYEELKSDIIGM